MLYGASSAHRSQKRARQRLLPRRSDLPPRSGGAPGGGAARADPFGARGAARASGSLPVEVPQVDTEVLLIDEVLAVGDAAFQQKCFDEFHRCEMLGTPFCS